MDLVTVNLTKVAAFPVTIAGVNCNSLIDTGSTRGCVSETFYNKFMLPWLLKVFHLSVTSACGSTPLSNGYCAMSIQIGRVFL